MGQMDKPRRKPWPAELNALIGLVVIMAIFEIVGWSLVGQSFLMNKAIILKY